MVTQELKENHWYTNSQGNRRWVFNYQKGRMTNYGFFLEREGSVTRIEWKGSLGDGGNDNVVPADLQEVRDLLLNEAERRGFVVGAVFKGVEGIDKNKKYPIHQINVTIVNGATNQGLYSDNSWILYNGKWGEVLEDTTEETKRVKDKFTEEEAVFLEDLSNFLYGKSLGNEANKLRSIVDKIKQRKLK